MSSNPFDRLAPFIQEYIYSHEWTELRDIQVEACKVIFDTDAHLLLVSGTASGKTEAAFLPVLTLLHQDPSAGVGALYIGPLKALINDQFVRLQALLKEADIPVWHWHGDVSPAEKKKLLSERRGVLQITPESLEGMLMNRTAILPELFCGLRFVVIDEVHAFMTSDRGRQVLCQLQRLGELIGVQPRRIGLSATLGDCSLAELWLASGTQRKVITPKASAGRKLRLGVEHFYESIPTEVEDDGNSVNQPATLGRQVEPRDRYIYGLCKGRKSLIFSNSRSDAESIIGSLRQIAESEHMPDIFHVHHGSISASLREAAEQAMRDPEQSAVTAATLSLELGIDIGQLEHVIQMQAPYSVSSFLQRLGRSGRRGQPSEMQFVCSEMKLSGQEMLLKRIPWTLLQTIAILQLYLEEGQWIEPIPPRKYPFSLLYHQTMSVLAGRGDLSPGALAERVLSLSPFQNISLDDFRILLRHLIAIGHVQQMDEGGLIVGLEGERIVRNYRFYAVFAENPEFTVYEGSNEIGTIMTALPPGERFGLAGRAWEVMDIDPKRLTIQVERVKGKVETYWRGVGGVLHTRILQMMRQALLDSRMYAYLQPGAAARLKEARQLILGNNLAQKYAFKLGDGMTAILPWMGTVACRTLERSLFALYGGEFEISSIRGLAPFYLIVHHAKGTPEELDAALRKLVDAEITVDALVGQEESPRFEKYDEFVPDSLLTKAFAADHLDVEAMKDGLRAWPNL
jgi:ATP-dependent helicase Lhr and Lhr-like helicase